MGVIGVSITKKVAFRDSTQEFSNVYYYSVDIGYPSASESDALIDSLTATEKGFHSTLVSFMRGRVWKQVGSPSTNEMISQKNLSGTGTNTTGTYDYERAFLFRLRAGNDSRGNPVYLRKWYHSCGNGPGNVAPSSAAITNTSSLLSSAMTTMENAVDAVRTVTVGATVYHLQAKSGRQPTSGEQFKSHKYFEHHQLGDQWRAQ